MTTVEPVLTDPPASSASSALPVPPPLSPDLAAPWATHYVIVCCAIIGGILAYCGSDFADWPKLTIAPLTSVVTVVSKTANGGITYWGALLWGVGGASIGGAAGLACARWVVHRRAAMQLLGAWALAALTLASLYIVWSLWPL